MSSFHEIIRPELHNHSAIFLHVINKDPNGQMPLHWHDAFEIVYIRNGSGFQYINGENIPMPGLGMLPHSGMNGDKVCFMTWQLPRGVFKTFSAWAGLHSRIGTGSVEFRVQLDGITVWSSGKLEGGSEISLFMYDNDTFILYPYAEHGAKPCPVKLHVLGDAEALEIPAMKGREVKPLYKQYGETVFEWKCHPGQYVLFKIKR